MFVFALIAAKLFLDLCCVICITGCHLLGSVFSTYEIIEPACESSKSFRSYL